MKNRSSPEEVEEPIETMEDRARRTPMPNFDYRDILQASPSTRSMISRTATLTPPPSGNSQIRQKSLLAPQPGRGRPRDLKVADEGQNLKVTAKSPSPATQQVEPDRPQPEPTLLAATEEHEQAPRRGPGRPRKLVITDGDLPQTSSFRSPSQVVQQVEPDVSQLFLTPPATTETAESRREGALDQATDVPSVQRNAEAGPSTVTHGPRTHDINNLFNSDSDQSDIQLLSERISHNPPKRRRQTVRKCKGAPYIELPFLPLNQIKRFILPEGIRPPTPLSRNDQIQYRQTPPRSSHSLSADSIDNWNRERPARSGLFPQWAAMPEDSSSDLGGYGIDETEDEIVSSDEESSDGVEITRRTTRASRKGKEVERRRTTRAEAAKPKVYSRQLAHLDISSSRSDTLDPPSMPTRSGRDRTRKQKRSKSGTRTPKSTSAYDLDSTESEPSEGESEQEFSDDSESDYGYKPRGRGKGKGRVKREESPESVSDDVLFEHRSFCEKCRLGPADDLLEKARERKRKSKGKKRKRDDDAFSEEEIALQLEGWLTCERCVVSSHWGCLSDSQRKKVLVELQLQEGPVEHGCRKIRGVKIDEEASFLCGRCTTGSKCLVCHEDKLSPIHPGMTSDSDAHGANGHDVKQEKAAEGDVEMDDGESTKVDKAVEKQEDEGYLLFRCYRCKQEAHYAHLRNPFPNDEEASLPEIALHYQQATERKHNDWECHQCRDWVWTVDNVIAWRPLPAGATEDLARDEVANYKEPLSREYLVKWVNRGFRHLTWVPHPWLLAAAPAKLKNFLIKGPSLDLITDETLAARGDDMAAPTISMLMEEADRINGDDHQHHKATDGWIAAGPPPDADAESSIPPAWSTVDRILDVMLLPPPDKPKAKKGKRYAKRQASADSPALSTVEDATIDMIDGIEPPQAKQFPIDDWEEETGRVFDEDDVEEVAKMVTWYYVKWDDLQYDQSTWDTPPPSSNERLFEAYKTALRRYLRDRKVVIPVLDWKQCDRRELTAEKFTRPPSAQPECIKGGTLMPFQMNGFQWLLTKYFKRESCILADDMGLGKTIQIASLLGYLGSDTHKIYPFLVVVPNSTITNWVREFEKWVPHMRVVPYYGLSASRKIISRYELYRKGMQGEAAGLKAHVVLTTYDMITGSDFTVFRNIPRWEMLIVDEGQRLKSDSSLMFNRLKSLNSVHRILLTGTPLNNNLRELFNLLNFLDPANFNQLSDLEGRFADLNETLLGELHDMIQPYILRRIKADVLRLPPKIEIIVPISLTPIQKKVYKSVLEKHADLIQAVMAQRKKRPKPAISGGEPKDAPEAPVNGTSQNGGQSTNAPEAPVNGTAQTAEASTINAEPVQASEVVENGAAAEATPAVTASVEADVQMEEPVVNGTDTTVQSEPLIIDGPIDKVAETPSNDQAVENTTVSGDSGTAEGGGMVVDTDHSDSAQVEDAI